MRAALQKGKVMYNDHVVVLSRPVHGDPKQRKQYNQAKLELQALNINFSLIFPAKMRIFHEGNQNLFHTEVEEFIKCVRQQSNE